MLASARVTSTGGLRVFVAGATGVIGRSLVPRLVSRGHRVFGMTRRPDRVDALRAAGAEPVVCDAFDAAGLRAVLRQAGPDVVVDQLTEIPATLEPRRFAEQLAATNRLRTEGTRNLVAAAQAAGARRLVAQSVAFAYAPTGGWVKDERAPLHVAAPPPMRDVFAAVAEHERLVLAAGGMVLRYGYFYGPGTALARDGFYAAVARRWMFPVVGAGTGVWSFIHVDDAADATVLAVERDSEPGTVFNIVDDEPAPAREWVPAFARAVGAVRPLRVPALAGRLAGGRAAVAVMTTQRGASNAKARRELGWAPAHPTWRDGFRSL
jgi:nucleoside-diphosphate-sugar epimerase